MSADTVLSVLALVGAPALVGWSARHSVRATRAELAAARAALADRQA